MKSRPLLAPVLALPLLATAVPALAADDSGWGDFRELYQGLVETNTTLSAGSCTKAAQLAADHLAAAGMARENLHLIVLEDHPDEGNLVAVYPGSDKDAGAVLLLAHLDVVEADPADWDRDPFTLVEEDGWFYARGAADAKSLVAVWVDTLARFARKGHQPRRTVKVMLTCGEETNGAFNGAEWLAANRRELIDADFALNEGGGGFALADGTVVTQRVQVGEKVFANYLLDVRNPGGHSSAPRPDNAIYQLADALKAVEAHAFPVELSDVTRAALAQRAESEDGLLGAALRALLADTTDTRADAVISADPELRSNTRTTCVATLLDAGHASNALAQRATANINCRIFPGHSIEKIRDELAAAIGDPDVSVTTVPPERPAPPAPPLDEAVLGPMREQLAIHFPKASFGVAMSNGYTDSTFLTAAGIPAYGTPGPAFTAEPSGVHGLNERIRIDTLKNARAFLYDLIRAYAD